MEPALKTFKLIECPRDAMQGWPVFIETSLKIRYINLLLEVGFHTLDFGSFVSYKAVPQLRDTADVLAGLDLKHTNTTSLLCIVANEGGAAEALSKPAITYLGYPFSVSETFQQNNARSTIAGSFERLKNINKLCNSAGKELVVYLSMAFGNPYRDPYSIEDVSGWARTIYDEGIKTIYLADTVGNATPDQVQALFTRVQELLPYADIGLHIHAVPALADQMIAAAIDCGCLRVDSSMGGIGGCPFASNTLTGNLPTENIVASLKNRKLPQYFNLDALEEASRLSRIIFRQ